MGLVFALGTHSLCIAISRSAWLVALEINTVDVWMALGEACLRLMEPHIAARCYRQMGDAGMLACVWRTQKVVVERKEG